MKFEIAEIVLEITSSIYKVYLPRYSPFLLAPHSKQADITITIEDIEDWTSTNDIDKDTHCIYHWQRKENNAIMTFAKRGRYLDTSPENEIWVLVGNNDFTQWHLYIPMLAEQKKEQLNQEIENRPWLQRLFTCYCMDKKMAILHGALCEIDGNGYMFLGDSGAGKSTMCSIIEGEHQVYSDDRIVVKLYNGELKAFGTPWNIKNEKYCSPYSTIVKRVFFLSHGNNEIMEITDKKTQYCLLLRQIFHSDLFDEKDALLWILGIVGDMSKAASFYNYSFFPDRSCLKMIVGDSHDL